MVWVKLYEFGKVVVDELIHRDISDEEGDDPQSKSCRGWDGDEGLGEALGVGGWGWDGGGNCEGFSLLEKWRKKEKKWKGMVYIGFRFCEGGAIK